MPSLLPLDNLTGAALIGLILSAIVYGITLLQVYSYFIDYSKNDGKTLKLFVLLLLLLDTLHLMFVTHAVYWFTITNFGDFLALEKAVWSLDAQVVIAHVLAFLVQGFFSWRIYILSRHRNWWFPSTIVVISAGRIACTIGYTITCVKNPYFSEAYTTVPWTIAGLVDEIISDCLIMGGMIHYLGKATQFTRTKRAISKLIAYSVNTGILTTLCTIVTLATYMSNKQSMIYVPSFFVLGRLYSCSFMSMCARLGKFARRRTADAALNSRQIIRREMYGESRSSTAPVPEPIAFINMGNEAASGTQVRVTTQTVKDCGDSAWGASKNDVESA